MFITKKEHYKAISAMTKEILDMTHEQISDAEEIALLNKTNDMLINKLFFSDEINYSPSQLLTPELESLRDENGELRAKLERVESKIPELIEDARKKRDENTELRTRCDLLIEDVRTLRGELEATDVAERMKEPLSKWIVYLPQREVHVEAHLVTAEGVFELHDGTEVAYFGLDVKYARVD